MVATRGFARAVGAVTLSLALLVGALVSVDGALEAAAASAVATVSGGPTSPTVSSSGTVTVDVTISNVSKNSLKAGFVTVTPSSGPLLTSDDLTTWMGGKGYNANPVGSTPVAVIAAKSLGAVSLRFAASALPQPSVWGVRGLQITYTVDSKVIASTRSSVVLLSGSSPEPVKLATILPLVSPASSLGMMSEIEIAQATSATGYLSQKLSLAAAAPITLALDPRITTSILALGAKAPASATAWLRTLNTSSKTGFWLTYADSDTAGLIQAGAPGPLSPALDDVANIPSPASGTSWGGSSWPGWAPTLSNISWPIANKLSSGVLARIISAGDTRVIASSDNLAAAAPVNSMGRANGAKIVTVNAAASACAQALEVANSPGARTSAAACLASRIAVAASGSSSPATVIIALSRSNTGFSSGSLSATLDTISHLSFAVPSTLDSVISAPGSAVEISSRSESKSRTNALKGALARQAKIVAFSPVAASPEVVINPGQRRLAAIASTAWLGSSTWNVGLDSSAALTQEVLNSVSIVTSSTINMVSGQARIPVVVRNNLSSAVSVTVHAVPSNPRISVGSSVPLTIEANAQARAYLPVTARVGNGAVTLEVSLTDSAGDSVGKVANLPVNVRADWETFGLWGLAVIFFGLIIAGVIRTVRRSKKKAGER